MRNKAHVLHLFVVPLITFLACNSFMSFLNYVGDMPYFLCLPVLSVTILYGLYLQFFIHKKKRNYIIMGVVAALSLGWCFVAPTKVVWLFGCAGLFTGMRAFMLSKGLLNTFKDYVWTLLATFLAGFMFPMSYVLSIAVFLTMQVLFEMNGSETKVPVRNDSFKDSYRMADSVLRGVGR
ncbi:MAG: hypothetical protein ABII18_02615 [bacterium]|nr:hypothetical protein [bacterium]MBU1919079.1 hypothetical protein [bacterium]